MKSINVALKAEQTRLALADEAARLDAVPKSTAVEDAAQAVLAATQARDAVALSVSLGEADADALATAEQALDQARLAYVSASSRPDLKKAATVRLEAVQAQLDEAGKGAALATIEALVGLQGEAATRYRLAADTLRAEALRMRALASLVRGLEAPAGLRHGKVPLPLDLDGAHLPATRWCSAPRGENLLMLRDAEVETMRDMLKAELRDAGLRL